MPIDYPWPEAPDHERLVVRLHPGEDPRHLAVLEWTGERFTGIYPVDREEQCLAPEDPMVCATPGLVDIQINGYQGRGFKDGDLGPEGIRDLCWSILLSGTTRFLPTITTDAPETMRAAMAIVDAACRAYPDVAAMVDGIHQEGPWLSPLDGPRGAHPREHVTLPTIQAFERFQAAAGGRIRLLTVAPEIDGGIAFIHAISRAGVVVCLGHHDADGETIQRAVEAGARGVTHLGNGCHNVMPRHPNVLWEQAAEDQLYAGIIVDGHHLPPATVKVLARAKPRDRLVLVSDAVRMAGAPPGLYHVREAIAEMTHSGRFGFYRSPTLIGAAVPLARCLANIASFCGEGQTPFSYLPHATGVPAALLGRPEITSQLGQPGAPATFVVWRWSPEKPDLTPKRIVLSGRTVYDDEELPIEVPFGSTARPATREEAKLWLSERTSRPALTTPGQ